MVRPGEKTADGYRAEAARVRQEAESVRQQLLNTQLKETLSNAEVADGWRPRHSFGLVRATCRRFRRQNSR
jgi:predicted ATPase